MGERVQKSAIPNTHSYCSISKWCCYRDGNGYCDTPRTNNGNSDAACYKMGNGMLLKMLEPIITGTE
jgi:hypothetical protein